MSKSPNILLCSDNNQTINFFKKLLDSSAITQLKISSFDKLNSEINTKKNNLIILEITNNINSIDLLDSLDISKNNIEYIAIVDSNNYELNKTINYLNNKNINNILYKPYDENNLISAIDKALEINSNKTYVADTDNYDEFSLAEAVRSLDSAVTITDTNRNIIYVNPALLKTFGYDKSELIGKQSNVLYPKDDPSGVSKKIYEAIFTLGWKGERIGVRKNGEAFQLYEKTSVVKDSNGKAVGIVSIHDDITERKRLEQALKESEEKHRTLIETAHAAIISIDSEGNIIMFNPAAEKLFGYNFDEIFNKNIFDLISDKFKDVFNSALNNENQTDNSFFFDKTIEIDGLKKEGEEFPMELSISNCKIEGKNIFTIIIFDITQRKSLEDQLIQSAKLAAVGELISGITHEINNPLAIVMGYAEMLMKEDDSSEELKKMMSVIYKESEKARKVIQNFLSFARQHSPEKESVNINEILDKTIALTEYDLKKLNIKLIKDYDNKLSMIMADPNQLQQVFLNLIINAEQAITDSETSEGMIKISSASIDKKLIKVSIEDNGPGIPEKIIEKIFNPFFTTKPVGKGTGLGLSISIGIIKNHLGELYARNKENGGAIFFIELPIEEDVI
ncbi:MAG: PAS domain S-box protein [Candidatus Dadabacteria bacterium]|nr:PAS domain S-box protein [Candidatus Dadabacteria bacterium]NIQ15898.1 PAS domain S-box protein [Candidatus Dadabacteria bacterium]